jgi:two-component system sensor histidine kinase KdpD
VPNASESLSGLYEQIDLSMTGANPPKIDSLDEDRLSSNSKWGWLTAVSWLTAVNWRPYSYSAGIVLLVTVLGLPIRAFIEPTNLVMLYLAAVTWIAIRWGRYPAIFGSILSTIIFDLVFVPPYYALIVDDAEYILTFFGLLGVGVVVSSLVAQVREQEKAAKRRERQTAALYDLNQKLAGAEDLQQIADVALAQLTAALGKSAAIFLPQEGHLQLQAATVPLAGGNEFELAAAVYKQGRPIGRRAEHLDQFEGRYLPLTATQGVVGVLAIYSDERDLAWSNEEERLLASFAGHIGLAIARALLAEEAKQIRLARETEKLYTTLLNSISHDLRTPLASITGVLSSLREDASLLPEAARTELINTAWEETERLNRLVGNLLDMTRLESGAMQIIRQPVDLEDLVGVALDQMRARLKERAVHTNLPPNLSLAPMDFVLMAQVLVNLLDNAVKYSPAGTPIGIDVHEEPLEIIISVRNEGMGIPDEEAEKVFDKFYRLKRRDDVGGTGLGLSICKGIVEAHNGRIWLENQAESGLAAVIALPKEAGNSGGGS